MGVYHLHSKSGKNLVRDQIYKVVLISQLEQSQLKMSVPLFFWFQIQSLFLLLYPLRANSCMVEGNSGVGTQQ